VKKAFAGCHQNCVKGTRASRVCAMRSNPTIYWGHTLGEKRGRVALTTPYAKRGPLSLPPRSKFGGACSMTRSFLCARQSSLPVSRVRLRFACCAEYPISSPDQGICPSTRPLGMSANRVHMPTRVVCGTPFQKRKLAGPKLEASSGACIQPGKVCIKPALRAFMPATRSWF